NGVEENALHAAFNDARFEPVTPEELAEIDIEVSLLTVPEKLRNSDPEEILKQITPFEDGVIVQKGNQRATFLPQVWEQLPDPETFLAQLCQKACLDAHAWQTGDLTVFTYQVASFKETRESHGH
ncbi:MAG: AmmeMemoRadiSam system protein A, partial [Desulfotignum sp.]|nr:AmmeMemoRadiSam system protein A [Desulfotignum sp.]